jgi:hypothetical protein
MLTEMVVTHVDVLGARAKFRKSGKFQGSRIVFKHFALDVGLSADDWDVVILHFLD